MSETCIFAVSVSRPPSAKLPSHSTNRYASKYALKNRNLMQVFDFEPSQTPKQPRAQSAKFRQDSAKDRNGSRRAKSATISRTKEYVSEQYRLHNEQQQQLVLYEPQNKFAGKITPSTHHTGIRSTALTRHQIRDATPSVKSSR